MSPFLLLSLRCSFPSSKLGLRLKVVALIDPATERAAAVLQKKCDSFVVSAYRDTRVYKTLDDFVKNVTPKERPRAFVIGSPPMFRGTLQSGRDIEMQIQKHFPGVAMFIEKPIATGDKSEIDESFKVAKFISESGAIVSVGCGNYLLYLWSIGSICVQVHAEVPQGYPEDETNHRGKQSRRDGYDRTLCLRLRINCQARLVGQVEEVGAPYQSTHIFSSDSHLVPALSSSKALTFVISLATLVVRSTSPP